jgi:predicted nucleic acid-binding protein
LPVADASFGVALLAENEPHHAAAQSWYDAMRVRGVRLRVPAIFLAEVSAAFTRGQQDPARAEATIATILRIGTFEISPVSAELGKRAADIARTAALRGCDAIYVALAQELDDVLVTLDDEQFRRGGRVVRVERPA